MGKDEIILERKSDKNNTNFFRYIYLSTFFILLVSISSLEEVRSQNHAVFRPPLKHCYHPRRN